MFKFLLIHVVACWWVIWSQRTFPGFDLSGITLGCSKIMFLTLREGGKCLSFKHSCDKLHFFSVCVFSLRTAVECGKVGVTWILVHRHSSCTCKKYSAQLWLDWVSHWWLTDCVCVEAYFLPSSLNASKVFFFFLQIREVWSFWGPFCFVMVFLLRRLRIILFSLWV